MIVFHYLSVVGIWIACLSVIGWFVCIALDLKHVLGELLGPRQINETNIENTMNVLYRKEDPTTPEYGATRNARQAIERRRK